MNRIMETIKLTIDNKEIDVPKGTTIYKAAKELGIDIPTLCYMEFHDALGHSLGPKFLEEETLPLPAQQNVNREWLLKHILQGYLMQGEQ